MYQFIELGANYGYDTKDYIHLCLCEPNDTEVKEYLDLRAQPEVAECDWVDNSVADTPSIFSIEASIDVTEILAGNPLKWSALPVGSDKRISTSFDNYAIPLYECLFTKVGVLLPFSNFQVSVLKNLKVPPSQLHPTSWVYMRTYQLSVEYKSRRSYLGLFLTYFTICIPPRITSRTNDSLAFY